MGFPTQDQGKTVDRIISVVHQHLDVIEDPDGEILGFIDGEQKRLFLVMVQVPYLLLNGAKPSRFPAFVINAEYCTEFLVELRDTDGGPSGNGSDSDCRKSTGAHKFFPCRELR